MDMSIEDTLNDFEYYQINCQTYKPVCLILSECFGHRCILMWNSFLLLLYEHNRFSTLPIVYYHTTCIHIVECIKNIVLLLDDDENLFFTTLRKEGKANHLNEDIQFKKIFDNVLNVSIQNEEIIIIHRKESSYWMNLYKIIGNSKFKVHRKIELNLVIDFKYTKFFLKHLNFFSIDFIENVLEIQNNKIDLDSSIIFIIENDKVIMENFNTNKIGNMSLLMTSPIPIKHIEFDKSKCSAIYLCLVTGSIMILSFNIIKRKVDLETIHLNCSFKKIYYNYDYFIYTDGNKTWKSKITFDNDNESKANNYLIKVSKLYDFVYDHDNNSLYCSTFNNLICFIKLNTNDSIPCEEKNYIRIPDALKETEEIFNSLLEESKRNENVRNDLILENDMLTIIALKHQSDLVSKHLISKVNICDINDVRVELANAILITEMCNYYMDDVIVYTVEYNISDHFKQRYKTILKTCANMWHLNIQIKCSNFTQTTCINVTDIETFKVTIPLKKYKLSIPYVLHVKLIALIPDRFNKNISLWCILPAKDYIMNVQHHIKPYIEKNALKRYASERTFSNMENRIINLTKKYSNLLCDVVERKLTVKYEMSYYIKIPENLNAHIRDFFENFAKCIDSNLAEIIVAQFTKAFEMRENDFKISILDYIIGMKIIQDTNIKKMKLTSLNVLLCWEVYSYVCKILTPILSTHKSVPHFDYMRLQKMKTTLNHILVNNYNKWDDILKVSEEFYSHIIGILPLSN